MPMMGWCTAEPSKRLKASRPNCKLDWKSAASRCTRRKPRSSIARMENAKGGIRTSHLTFLDTNFGRAWSGTRETGNCFVVSVSPSALKAIRSTVRDLNIRQLTQRSLDDIAKKLNPLLRGWIGYYGGYNR